MKNIFAYTDGSAVVKGAHKGKGGFGTYIPNFYGKRKAYSLGFEDTKTGRMEITALLFAIKAFHVNHKEEVLLSVYSDSEYVVKTFTENRLERWILAGWTNTSGEVKNIDLWKQIISSLEDRPFLKLEMNHIKSHQIEKEKNPVAKAHLLLDPHIVGNMIADALADYKRHKTLLKTDKLQLL